MDTENHIFEPDIVLSSEILPPRTGLPEPEHALMIAVLEEAARCFLNHCTATDRKKRVLYEDARDWFLSDERSHLYDFANVCDVLGIHVEYLRRRMLDERDRRRTLGPVARRAAG